MKEFIGSLVRSARKNKNMTQEDLAAAIDLSVQAISNMERGETLPTLTSLTSLSKTLDIPIQSFFRSSAPEKVDNERQKIEADIQAALSQLNTRSLKIALRQIKALSEG